MSAVIGNPLLLSDEGYQISRSVRLRSSANAYFSKTFAASSGTTDTFSFWVKRGKLGSAQSVFDTSNGTTTSFGIYFTSADALEFYDYSSAFRLRLVTTQVFRDASAWYHIVCQLNTANATAANRAKVYVNGVEVTSFSTATYPAQNTSLNIGSTQAFGIGVVGNAGGQNLDGYLTEINFIDGQALTPSSFGETDAVTGVWKPKKYTGTYGTNGFYLNFSDNSSNTATTIGKDYSGNGNNWTPNNISVTSGSTYDSMLDVPTMWADGGNGRGNYATLNPLRYSTNGTLSEANLKYSNGSGDNGAKALSTIGIPSGKWYFEGQWISGPSNSRFIIGFASSSTAVTSASMLFERDGSNLGLSTSDIANVAIDFDAGKIWYGKNNVWQSSGDPATGANPIQTFTPSSYDFLYPGIRLYAASDGTTVGVVNFGQRPFSYTPPSGFKALNTQNLPEPTIKKGNQYFDINLWTGNGSSQTITNSAAMAPDLVWVKERSSTSGHTLYDTIRGATKYLESNATAGEGTDATTLTAFNSNGFSVGSSGALNENTQTYVGWQWKEGATPGFDIVTYTGTGANATVGHGLGVAPKMMILKVRGQADNWSVYHASLGATIGLQLNTTAASNTNAGFWNNTAPTSSVFTAGTFNSKVSDSHVAYCFSEVPGFSKFGSYTGNGSADGPFVFTGFLPRWIMIKRTDSTSSWLIIDTSRQSYNVQGPYLVPNSSDAETTGTTVLDIVSNGFKSRSSSTLNTNGGTYIYAAFAETPFRYALAR